MRSHKRFLKHEGGVALIEFVLVFPFLFLLLFGGIEVIRLLYIQQKLEKAGYVIADVVTRYDPAQKPLQAGEISVAEMNTNVFPIMGRIMSEFKDPTKQAVIVTSIVNVSGTLKIQWQMGSPNPGNTTYNSMSGTTDAFGNTTKSMVNGLDVGAITAAVVNTTPTFPGFSTESGLLTSGMPNGENVIISEVFFYYTPIMQSALQGVNTLFNSATPFYLSPKIYVKRTYFVPRNGNLVYLPPTFPVP